MLPPDLAEVAAVLVRRDARIAALTGTAEDGSTPRDAEVAGLAERAAELLEALAEQMRGRVCCWRPAANTATSPEEGT